MNKYAELRQRQQEEFNALPLGFAFSRKQFDEMMQEWGLDPEKDLDKLLRIPGGGYVQKKDADLLHQTTERHSAEMAAAIAEDETGEGFIYEMFLYELDNHEYGYTRDTEDTLDALGYTAEEVLNDPRLKRGIEKAVTEICKREGN
ncbi:hypothetical protein [uncultured Oscillibacter sp.]|uniref:DUF7659 family protein n=1 Tax=uncultured Oscillibacter sp. TaxID=876091 RepID=UPI0025E4B345|nr:hypothetical protein [uncultured Oscillibacter sp.]